MIHHVSFDLEFRKNTTPGLLVAIEGIDGAGKSTQAKEVVKRLNKEGIHASYSKEPTDMVIGQFIREKILSGDMDIHPLALQYLFNADRVMHIEKIQGLLQKGMVIVMDRYFWSSIAYAMADMGMVEDWSLTAFSILSFYHQFTAPDMTFYLNISSDVALERIAQSGKHNEIYDSAEKLPKIESGYQHLMEKFPEMFINLNAEKKQEEITSDIVTHIKTLLQNR